MRNRILKKIVASVLIIFSFENLIAQETERSSTSKSDVDRPGPGMGYERPTPRGRDIDWTQKENPKDAKSKKDSPGSGKKNTDGNKSGGDRVPAPQPVEDSPGSTNYGDRNSGNSSGKGNSNPGERPVSSSDSKSDEKFNDIIDRGPRENEGRGLAGEYAKGENDSNSGKSYNRESETYKDLIPKGKAAKQVVAKEKATKQKKRQQSKSYLGPLIAGKTHASIQNMYINNDILIPPQKKSKIQVLLISAINSVLALNPNYILSQTNSFAAIKKELYEKELQRLLRGKSGNSIQAVLEAEKIMQNWMMIAEIIGDSLFSDVFIDVKSANQTVLNSIRMSELPPDDLKIYSILNQAKEKALSRYYEYVTDTLSNLQNVPLSSNRKGVLEDSLRSAMVDLSNGNYISAAANLVNAKSEIAFAKDFNQVSQTAQDLAMLGTGPVQSVVKGIEKYTTKEILEKILTIEDRNLVRNMISKGTKNGITVLGKFDHYVNYGTSIEANILDIPREIWNKLDPADWWPVNRTFLNNAIKRGDRFLLSESIKSVESVRGTLRKELDYLVKNHYHLSDNGLEMVKNNGY